MPTIKKEFGAKMSRNAPIKIEVLDRPAPPEITRILDGLDLLTRNVLLRASTTLLTASLRTLAISIGERASDTRIRGYADALMLTRTIDAYKQHDIASYARILAHPDEQYQVVPKSGK